MNGTTMHTRLLLPEDRRKWCLTLYTEWRCPHRRCIWNIYTWPMNNVCAIKSADQHTSNENMYLINLAGQSWINYCDGQICVMGKC